MKSSLSRRYPVEIAGIPAGILTVSISIDAKYLPILEANGFMSQELHNYQVKLLDDARDAMDGSVAGLIISNLEE